MVIAFEQIRSCRRFVPDPADWWKDESIQYSEDRREEAIRESIARQSETLQEEFNRRAEKWEIESAIHSSPGSKFLHKDFIWIITRGKQIVPLILERLNTSRSDWFWALENITQENPAKDAKDFKSAVKAWQAWGWEDHSKK